MKENICVACNKLKIMIKRHSLCHLCYRKIYKAGQLSDDILAPLSAPTIKKYQQEGEVEFVRNFFTHTNWVHRPCVFKLGTTAYAPDFYDKERNVFIEVAATRQAYSENRDKYLLMQEYFPGIVLEIRQPSGTKVDINERVHWDKKNGKKRLDK